MCKPRSHYCCPGRDFAIQLQVPKLAEAKLPDFDIQRGPCRQVDAERRDLHVGVHVPELRQGVQRLDLTGPVLHNDGGRGPGKCVSLHVTLCLACWQLRMQCEFGDGTWGSYMLNAARTAQRGCWAPGLLLVAAGLQQLPTFFSAAAFCFAAASACHLLLAASSPALLGDLPLPPAPPLPAPLARLHPQVRPQARPRMGRPLAPPPLRLPRCPLLPPPPPALRASSSMLAPTRPKLLAASVPEKCVASRKGVH